VSPSIPVVVALTTSKQLVAVVLYILFSSYSQGRYLYSKLSWLHLAASMEAIVASTSICYRSAIQLQAGPLSSALGVSTQLTYNRAHTRTHAKYITMPKSSADKCVLLCISHSLFGEQRFAVICLIVGASIVRAHWLCMCVLSRW
jgi:hypothetical protein